MKKCIAQCVWIFVVALCSCSRTTYVPVTRQHNEVITLRDTTIIVTTVAQTAHNVTTDTVSLLTNEYATSRAEVSQGQLAHSLIIHPRRDSVVVRLREVHTIDSIPYIVPMPSQPIEVTPSWLRWLVALSLVLSLTIAVVVGKMAIKR